MCKLKYLLAIAFAFLLLPIFYIEALAVDSEGSYIAISDEEKTNILASLQLSKNMEESEKRAIKCFSVNETGEFAIGVDLSTFIKNVSIYSADGIFLYSYTFECWGAYGIELSKDVIRIYLARSSLIVEITPKTDSIDIFKINGKENEKFWSNTLRITELEINSKVYRIENDDNSIFTFMDSFSFLTVTDSSGEKNVLYDASIHNTILANERLRGFTVFLVCFVAISSTYFITLVVKKRK